MRSPSTPPASRSACSSSSRRFQSKAHLTHGQCALMTRRAKVLCPQLGDERRRPSRALPLSTPPTPVIDECSIEIANPPIRQGWCLHMEFRSGTYCARNSTLRANHRSRVERVIGGAPGAHWVLARAGAPPWHAKQMTVTARQLPCKHMALCLPPRKSMRAKSFL
jgi:hypothetical protein